MGHPWLRMLSDNFAAGRYRCRVELLERDGALATLVAAHEAAAGGAGRVVFVTGELVDTTSEDGRVWRTLGRPVVRKPFDFSQLEAFTKDVADADRRRAR